jgi:hypothetical protein
MNRSASSRTVTYTKRASLAKWWRIGRNATGDLCFSSDIEEPGGVHPTIGAGAKTYARAEAFASDFCTGQTHDFAR